MLETHVHNDYLSGAVETRAATGAEIAAPARGGYAGGIGRWTRAIEMELGALRLVSALATPGHTPEHLAWAVSELGTSAGTANLTRPSPCSRAAA